MVLKGDSWFCTDHGVSHDIKALGDVPSCKECIEVLSFRAYEDECDAVAHAFGTVHEDEIQAMVKAARRLFLTGEDMTVLTDKDVLVYIEANDHPNTFHPWTVKTMRDGVNMGTFRPCSDADVEMVFEDTVSDNSRAYYEYPYCINCGEDTAGAHTQYCATC
jgi:hypothetical protein